MISRLYGAKLLSDPVLTYCHFKEITLVKFELKLNLFIPKNNFKRVFRQMGAILFVLNVLNDRILCKMDLARSRTPIMAKHSNFKRNIMSKL